MELNPSEMIFPLLFLKAKLFCQTDQNQAVLIFHEMLNRYEAYNKEEKNPNDIITIETYNSNFQYLQIFFNTLFYISNLEVKIKKIYFELKLTLTQMGFNIDAYSLLERMNEKYPNDIKIQFELAKDSLMLSKVKKYNEVIAQMKENSKKVENDKKLQSVYDNYIQYAEILFIISKGDFDNAKAQLTKMLGDDPENILLVNNISILNLFQNKVKECYDNLKKFATEMDCMNDVIKQNLNLLADLFKFPNVN